LKISQTTSRGSQGTSGFRLIRSLNLKKYNYYNNQVYFDIVIISDYLKQNYEFCCVKTETQARLITFYKIYFNRLLLITYITITVIYERKKLWNKSFASVAVLCILCCKSTGISPKFQLKKHWWSLESVSCQVWGQLNENKNSYVKFQNKFFSFAAPTALSECPNFLW